MASKRADGKKEEKGKKKERSPSPPAEALAWEQSICDEEQLKDMHHRSIIPDQYMLGGRPR